MSHQAAETPPTLAQVRASRHVRGLSRDDLKALRAEVRYCKRAQSWSPGSTRSAWWMEVEDYADAVEDLWRKLDELDEAERRERDANAHVRADVWPEDLDEWPAVVKAYEVSDDAYEHALSTGHVFADRKAERILAYVQEEIRDLHELHRLDECPLPYEDLVDGIGDLERSGRDTVVISMARTDIDDRPRLYVMVDVYCDARVVAPDVLCPDGAEQNASLVLDLA